MSDFGDSDDDFAAPPSDLLKKVRARGLPAASRADVYRAWDATKLRELTSDQHVDAVVAWLLPDVKPKQAPTRASAKSEGKRKAPIDLSDDSGSDVEIVQRVVKRSKQNTAEPIDVQSDDESFSLAPLPPKPPKGKGKQREVTSPAPQPAAVQALPPSSPPVESQIQDPVMHLASIFPQLDQAWAHEYLKRPELATERAEKRGDALAEYLFTLGPDYPKVAPAAEAIHPPPPLSSPTRRANDIDKKREEYMTPRAISVQYKTIAYELLVERFPMAGKSDLRVLHNRYNGAYTPTYFDLRADLALPQPRYNRLKKARPIRHRLLHIGDAALRTEVTWVDLFVEQEEAELKAFKKEKQRLADEKLALELADKDDEKNGRFLACGCCFGDFPARKIVQCADGHLFCIECVCTFVEGRIGDRQVDLPCMDENGCSEAVAPDDVLRRILKKKTFDLLENIRQQKAVEDAGLTNFITCPFCDFGYCCDNENERLFYCHNEDCKKTSCRQCRKDDHLPRTCEEADQDRKINTVHLVEEAMTEALLRKCPKCTQAFVKQDGCNKMACPNCGTLSCFICRKTIAGYDHFDRSAPGGPSTSRAGAKCPLFDNTTARTEKEIEDARKKAAQDVLEKNPDVEREMLDRLKNKTPPPAAPRPVLPAFPGHGAGQLQAVQAYYNAIHQQIVYDRNNYVPAFGAGVPPGPYAHYPVGRFPPALQPPPYAAGVAAAGVRFAVPHPLVPPAAQPHLGAQHYDHRFNF